jgi:hypothetical protein
MIEYFEMHTKPLPKLPIETNNHDYVTEKFVPLHLMENQNWDELIANIESLEEIATGKHKYLVYILWKVLIFLIIGWI